MKHSTQTLSATTPDEFIINKLNNTLFELTYNENTESVELPAAEDSETTTQYQYDTYTAIVTVKNYEEMVAALIALKYSIADEISLSRKSDDDEEYTAYLAFVAACKSYAKSYYGIEE